MCGTPSQEEEALRAIDGDARAATGAGGKTIRKRDGCHQGRRGGSTAAGGPRRRKPPRRITAPAGPVAAAARHLGRRRERN
jgi:hypothetical protein